MWQGTVLCYTVLRIFLSAVTGTFTMLKFEYSWRLSRGKGSYGL